MRKSEAAPDQMAAGKNILDFFRRRICRDVEILGYFTQQQITNAASHDVGFISCLLQISDNIACIRAQFVGMNAMLCLRDSFELIDFWLLPDTQWPGIAYKPVA